MASEKAAIFRRVKRKQDTDNAVSCEKFCLTKQSFYVFGCRMCLNICRRVQLFNLSVIDNQYSVGKPQSFADIVRYKYNGGIQLLVQVLNGILQNCARDFVYRAEGLIHKHNLRLAGKSAGYADALLLTAA